MKKFFMGIFLAVLAVSLSACTEGKGEVRESVSEIDDFVCYTGSSMTVAPEGYYALNGDINGYFLYYITPDFSKSTIVCDKQECIHNERNIENLTDYVECNAYCPGANAQLEYYDGYLYTVVSDIASSGGVKDVIYKISPDGTEKTLWYTAKQKIMGFCIYKGKIYLGEQVYTSDGAKTMVTTFPVEEPDKEEVLYQTEDYGERTLNRMKCYGDFCYFYLLKSAEIGESAAYIQVNIEDKTAKEIYPPADVNLELGDYGVIMEFKEYTSYEDNTWNSTYYRRKKGQEELIPLTEEDFSSIGNGDTLKNMDKDYIYFISINTGKNAVPEEKQKVSVYDYEGNLMAEIPAKGFGRRYFVLPGTDQYMFIQSMDLEDFSYDYYYVDKEEFDGGMVEAHKIPMDR